MQQPLVLDHPVLVSLHFCCCVKDCATDNCKSLSAFEDMQVARISHALILCLAMPNHVSTPLLLVQALLNGSSRDPSEDARKAARSALSHLPLTALSLVPLLTTVDKAAATEVDMPAPKTRKRSQAESSVKQAADGLDILHLAGQPLSSSTDCRTLSQSPPCLSLSPLLPIALQAELAFALQLLVYSHVSYAAVCYWHSWLH